MKIMQRFIEKHRHLNDYRPVTIAFLGDSVTQGCFELYNITPERIETVFDQNHGYHQYLKEMLATLYTNVPVNTVNAGISGGNAPHGLQRLERDILSSNPDLVVVCFGLNDCGGGLEKLEKYTTAMEGIFARLEQEGIESILMTPNMMCTKVDCRITDPYQQKTAEKCAQKQNDGILKAYLEEAKKIAAAHGAAICDCYAKWETLHQNGVNINPLLSNYINHPTREMNKLFAVSLLETMLK